MSGAEVLKARLREAGPGPLIIAHRGIWGPLPENSIAAIRAAGAYDCVEIDVQVAADGGLVVHHDASLERMTGEDRLVKDLASKDIISLSLREGAGGQGAPASTETVPDLASALAAAGEIIFDLDAKNADEVMAVADGAAALGATANAAVKVDVTSPDDIDALLVTEGATGLMVTAKVALSDPSSIDLIARLRSANVALAEVWFADLDLLRAAADAGGDDLRLSTYTLDPVHCLGLSDSAALADPEAVWGVLMDAGIGALMTDQPAALRDFIVDRKASRQS